MQTNQRFNVKAPLACDTDLYRFQAKPAVHALAHIATSGKQRSFLLLHKRLGHPNVRILHYLSRSQAIRGLDDTAYPKEPFFCTACTLCGPLPVPILTGCRYFVVFIDDYS
ncbi:hypothetical protein PHPALM_27811 [Phytophthora palmivora]|uniref:GAG-pre-integrase domain-containing protein n=1 Tax=Phytophthora palmivora TaxID=4796 RepID=A0A2P4XBN1_9STRA|nr:hypothetical protein PHPALM_27811 [Phytophthora palmivora]